jgi:hypothetical protein
MLDQQPGEFGTGCAEISSASLLKRVRQLFAIRKLMKGVINAMGAIGTGYIE